jgi:hypothetical protein
MAAKFKNALKDKLSSIQNKLKPDESSTCQARKNEWIKAHSFLFVVG